MSSYEPSKLETWITVLVGKLLGRTIYKPYVESLDLQGDERVLDFGSGAGMPARYLASQLQPGGGHLTCLDVSRRWQEVARSRLSRFDHVDFVQGDIQTLDIPNGSFDVVFIHFVLHDIPTAERPSVAHHLARVLAHGGRLFIREPLRFISREEIRHLLEESGLTEQASRQTEITTQGQVYEGAFTAS